MKFIVVTLPACPVCQSVDLQTYGSRSGGGGVVPCGLTRYTRCRDCGERFQVCVLNARPRSRMTAKRNLPKFGTGAGGRGGRKVV